MKWMEGTSGEREWQKQGPEASECVSLSAQLLGSVPVAAAPEGGVGVDAGRKLMQNT